MADRLFSLGVILCVLNKDFSKILLLKRNEEKRKRNKADWGNVGGIVEFGETLINACTREAEEEIGVKLNHQKIKLIELKEAPFFNEKYHAIWFVYATIMDEKEEINLNKESEGHSWFSFNNLPDKTLDPKEDLIKWSKIAQKELSENGK